MNKREQEFWFLRSFWKAIQTLQELRDSVQWRFPPRHILAPIVAFFIQAITSVPRINEGYAYGLPLNWNNACHIGLLIFITRMIWNHNLNKKVVYFCVQLFNTEVAWIWAPAKWVLNWTFFLQIFSLVCGGSVLCVHQSNFYFPPLTD